MSESCDRPLTDEFAEWLATPVGQYVQQWEQKKISGMVTNVFGYHAIQIGLPHWDLLEANRIPYKGRTHWDLQTGADGLPQVSVVAEPEHLPFDSQSIDLLILPHVLECSNSPHQVLREAERVLVPEGRVVISGFNPWSLWGAHERIPGLDPIVPVPAHMQVSLVRLKDWFKLLSFEVDRGHFGCYVPPCVTTRWIERWSFMEKAGDRWWPFCGALYVVSAVKRVPGMRLIGPAWKKSKQKLRAQAVVAGRQANGAAYRWCQTVSKEKNEQ